MKNKKALVSVLIIVLIVVLLIVAVMAIRSGMLATKPGGDDIFGNTTTVREPPPQDESGEVGVDGNDSYWGDDSENTGGLPVLRLLSKEPVAGATGVLFEPEGYAPEEHARFIERSTGHVKDIRLDRIEDPSVVRNDTMLRIGRVYWSPNGTTSLVQRLDGESVKIYSYLTTFGLTFALASSSSSTTDSIAPAVDGRHLEFDSIIAATISPDARLIFYIVKSNDGSVGYVENVVLGSRREVWRSPLISLTAYWGAPDTVVIHTNPTSDATGHVWLLNVVTGDSTLAVGGEYALAARPSRDGTRLLYSLQEKSSGVTSLRVLSLGTTAVVYLPPSVSSLVEKCTWGTKYPELVYCAVPRNLSLYNYLEDWYLGLVASDDVLWQINTTTGEAHQILDPVTLTTETFDIVDLEVSPLGNFLIFKTKINDLLWAALIPAERLPILPEDEATSTVETL